MGHASEEANLTRASFRILLALSDAPKHGYAIMRESRTQTGGDATSLSMEGLVQVEWAMFRFDSPELDLLTTVKVFPSLSDAGRVRSDGDLRVQYEVINDFFLGLTVFLAADSRPPSEDATRRDFGTTITLGWSF